MQSKAEEQKAFTMTINSFSVRFRALTLLAVAAVSMTAAHAQTDDAPISNRACADVKPPVPYPQNVYTNIRLYLVPSGAPQHQSVCEATKALATGMVVISFDNDAVLADAMGDPGPNLDSDTVSEFPYLAPGSRAVPGMPPPGPSPEVPEGFHAYAAFVDPTTGVGYSFSSVGEQASDSQADVADWISSTVEPLLKAGASSVRTASAVSNPLAFAAAAPSNGGSGYNPNAWSFMKSFKLAASGNQIQRGTIHGLDRVLGANGAEIRVYRLNVSKENDDYFLVDTKYTQTPRYDPFTYGFLEGVRGFYWANAKTEFELQARNPASSTIIPRLIDFSPRTPVTQRTDTFTVGATLGGDVSGINGSLEASYSVSVTQDSVQTAVNGTIGTDVLRWTDTYNGFRNPFVKYPSTLINTFTGERLAIFKVPRTINDSRPTPGAHYNPTGYAGLLFFPSLDSVVQGYSQHPFTGSYDIEYANFVTHMTVFVPEPQFSASPLTDVVVSKSLNSVTKPVIIKVVAELADGEEKLAWRPQLQTSGLETDAAQGETGSGQFAIYPTANAVPGTTTTILLNTVPPAAADSVRKGALKIQVKIVN
jgi:hypothetical protein